MESGLYHWNTHPIEALVLVHFPELHELMPQASVFKCLPLEKQQAKRDEAEAFRKKLELLTEADLQVEIVNGKELAKKHFETWKAAEIAKPFYERIFANMDVDHWSRAAYWTADEATALSFGKDPRQVTRASLKSLARGSRFAVEYDARFEILKRAVFTRELFERTPLRRFLPWIERTRFPMPEKLLEAAKAIHGTERDWKAEFLKLQAEMEKLAKGHHPNAEDASPLSDEFATTEKTEARSLGARERESLLKLVIGMAIKGYGHNPEKGRTKTASELAGDLASLGIPLSDDTIRAYLQEASELLPPPETEQKS